MKHLRVVLLLGLVGLGLFSVAWQRGWIDPVAPLRQADPPKPTTLFVVLDTVRADHLGVCGYERPNTPNLQRLVDQGASISCIAYAPGSWTLPSHASYFTGREVPDHGAHALSDGVNIGHVVSQVVRPLDQALPTLAERMEKDGFQAHLVSGNPVLAESSGLQRGFRSARVAPEFGDFYADDLLEQVRQTLRWDAELDRPLFLFVNIADVHQPWQAVPAGLGWVESRPALRYEAYKPDSAWVRYLTGTMPEEEKATYLPHLRDAYDYGIYRADATLGGLLGVLSDFNWDAAGLRVVITSDHGEHLGENGLVDHGASLFEPNQRVPVLVSDVVLPSGPLNAMVVHGLAQGALPTVLPPVRSASFPQPVRRDWARGQAFADVLTARWDGADKWLWTEGAELRGLDLQACPGEDESCWSVLETSTPAFDSYIEGVQASGAKPVDADADLMEALKAAGYVE